MTTRPRHFDRANALQAAESRGAVLGGLWGFVVVHALMAGVSLYLLLQSPIIILFGLTVLSVWAAVASLLHLGFAYCAPRLGEPFNAGAKPTFFRRVLAGPRWLRDHYASFTQWPLYLIALGSAVAFFAPAVSYLREPNQVLPDNLRFASVVYIGCAALLYLYANYIRILQRKLETAILPPLIRLSQVLIVAYAATSGALFFLLSTGYDVCWIGWVWLGLALVLALEPKVQAALRFYQPATLRKEPTPIGASLALELVQGSGTGAKILLRDFEDLIGAKVGEVWVFGFVRESLEAVLLVGLVLGWLSTSVRMVPIGNEGVLITFGHYEPETLKPGLHVMLPWPLQEIQLVQARQLRDVSLGFDKDLSGPLLWTSKHVEGEKNILVDDGEGLLTVNVPIVYRVSQPVQFVKNTIDADSALRYLAERTFIQIASTRESFHIMTEDRAPIAAELKERLQAEADRLNLGVEIIFVGLKDIHPPVDVTPAYENVISSQEKKEALVDEALAYQARLLPEAHAQAYSLVKGAEAAYANRTDLATGEATRFADVVAVHKANPGVMEVRLQFDALGDTLALPAKTIISGAGNVAPDCYLDLRLNSIGKNNLMIPANPTTTMNIQFVSRILLAVGLCIYFLASMIAFQVRENEKVVVTRFGQPVQVINEPGLYFKLPWPIESINRLDGRLNFYEIRLSEALTRDRRNVIVPVYVAWKIDDPLKFVEAIGTSDNARSKIESLVSSAKNTILGTYDFKQLVSTTPDSPIKIPEIETALTTSTAQQAHDNFGIQICQVGIERISLPEANTSFVFERMRAERSQFAERYLAEGRQQADAIRADVDAQKTVILAEAQRDAEIKRGKAEADAAQIYSQAHRQDPDFYLFLRKLETLRKTVNQNTTLVLDANQAPFDLLKSTKSAEGTSDAQK